MLSLSKLRNLIFCSILLLAGNSWAKSNEFLTHWRNAFIDCVREESLSPNLMIRNLSLFSVAVHDCLNLAKPKYQTYQKYNISPPPLFCEESAVAGCGWNLAQNLHPARLKAFADLSRHARSLDANNSVKNSFFFGGEISQKLLENRKNDGSSSSISYLTRTSPGLWRRTPTFYRPPEQPHWRRVAFWGLPELETFLPPPPPKPDSVHFRNALCEVKELGGKESQIRSKEQTLIARFWKDFSYTQTPPGHWNAIATFIATHQKFSLWEEAKLFALLNISMADAGVVAWECKYRHHLWRPVHAIRHANEFEITRKLYNPDWESLIETPAHPEYISAHSCYSGAAAAILKQTMGTDRFRFRAHSDEFPKVSRTFRSFSSCIDEISESRIIGGIHYRFSCENGLIAGKNIGSYMYLNHFNNLTYSAKMNSKD